MAARCAAFPIVFFGVFTTLTIAFVNRRKLLPNFDEVRERQSQESVNKAREIKQQLKEGVRQKKALKGDSLD